MSPKFYTTDQRIGAHRHHENPENPGRPVSAPLAALRRHGAAALARGESPVICQPRVMSDQEIAADLRRHLLEDSAPVRFATHPNAPCVVNRLEVRRGRLVHNVDPFFAKYATSYGAAEWIRNEMNRTAGWVTVWYIVR
jgi:hypothetical protein